MAAHQAAQRLHVQHRPWRQRRSASGAAAALPAREPARVAQLCHRRAEGGGGRRVLRCGGRGGGVSGFEAVELIEEPLALSFHALPGGIIDDAQLVQITATMMQENSEGIHQMTTG